MRGILTLRASFCLSLRLVCFSHGLARARGFLYNESIGDNEAGVEREGCVLTRIWRLALYIGKKALVFAFVMLLLSAAVFYASRIAPGDPLQSFYGDRVERMSAAEHRAAVERLGLDGPIYLQYGKWLAHALQGEFGISYKYKQPALDVLRSLIGNTLLLGGVAYALVFAAAIGLAMFCALYEDRWMDRLICQAGAAAYYIPSFWLGLVFILVFSVNLGWLPSGGAYELGKSADFGNRLRHMILPLAVMVLGHLWYYAALIRGKLLDETRQAYVLLAKAKGLSRFQIVRRHCLRSAAPSILSLMAISVTHILGGTYIVEAVFSYPGIGALSVESAKYHDYNLLMLIVLITGALVVLSGMLAQAVSEWLDPRMQAREGAVVWSKKANHLRS